MQVKELGHLVLYVRKLERSRRFYRDLLGWKEIMVPGEEIGFPAAAFTSGRTHHELLLIEVGEDATPIPKGRRVGMYHFGLKIGETDAELREAPTTGSRTASISKTRTETRSSCTSTASRRYGRTIRRPSSRSPGRCACSQNHPAASSMRPIRFMGMSPSRRDDQVEIVLKRADAKLEEWFRRSQKATRKASVGFSGFLHRAKRQSAGALRHQLDDLQMGLKKLSA